MNRGLGWARQLLAGAKLADRDRAAIGLLLEHREGYWLNFGALRLSDRDQSLDWAPGTQLLATEGVDPSDLAVLATALHIVGEDAGTNPLGSWWQHLDRLALASVLRAIAVTAGARAEVTDVGDTPLPGLRGIDVMTP